MPSSTAFSGVLNKKSRYRKKWRRRFFIVEDGIIKYFRDHDKQSENQSRNLLKGIFDLTGARMIHTHELSNTLEILLPQGIGNEIILEAPTEDALSGAIMSGINTRNIIALTAGSRAPEVVDWYYQQQAEFFNQTRTLEAETRFLLQYPLSSSSVLLSSGGASLQSHSTVVKVMVNKDQSGLLFRVDTSSQQSKFRKLGSGSSVPRHLSKLEAVTDGRVVSFREMTRVSRKSSGEEESLPPGLSGLVRDRGVSNVSGISSGDEGEAGYGDHQRPQDHSVDESRHGNDMVMSGAETLVMGVSALGGSKQPVPTPSDTIQHQHPTFEIVLTTPEEEFLLCQILPAPGSGMTQPQPSIEHMMAWYTAVKYAVWFVSVPPPSSTLRSGAAGARASSSAAAVHYGFFSMNSGLVFSCAGDVAVLLKSFESYSKTLPAINVFTMLITDIFKLIPDVQCNKEGASNFGERLEDVVRVLGDAKSGVLMRISPADSEGVNDQLSDLCTVLRDAKLFIQSLTSSGWLQTAMIPPSRSVRRTIRQKLSGKSPEKSQVRERYESFDSAVTTISNKLVKRYGDSSWVFKRKVYDMVVDVGVCIDALDGLSVIHNDPAKIRALARLIQADGTELERALSDLIESREGRGRSAESISCGAFFRVLCCGCCGKPDDKYKFARSRNTQSKKSLGNLDMALLGDEHGRASGSAGTAHEGRVGRDQMMSIDSDFGEVPSSRGLFTSQQKPHLQSTNSNYPSHSQHSYHDEDSTSNPSSAGGEYVSFQGSPGSSERVSPQHPSGGSNHRRIITPERGGNRSVLPKLP